MHFENISYYMKEDFGTIRAIAPSYQVTHDKKTLNIRKHNLCLIRQ